MVRNYAEILNIPEAERPPRTFKKVVLTGGPCAGKSAAQKAIKAQYGERVILVPEAATLLFDNGFPLAGREVEYSDNWNKTTQNAVFTLQRALENGAEFLARETEAELIVCDRGVFDDNAYLPNIISELCGLYGVEEAGLLADYDGVIHLETIATDPELPYGSETNATRLETRKQALALNAATKAAWLAVKNEVQVIPVFPTFEERATQVIAAIENIMEASYAS